MAETAGAAADRRCAGLGRAHLMQAAGELMTERGGIDVSIHDIARRSGTSLALIKYHFGHKDGLLLALLEKIIGDSVGRLEGLVRRDMPPRDKLRLHILGVLNVYCTYPYLSRLMHHLLSTSDEARRRISVNIVKPMVAAQTAILQEGERTGAFRHINPMSFYFQVIGACDHLYYGLYAMKYAFELEDGGLALKQIYGEELVESILNGIGTKP
ncbi:TetR family transcriptional regulator [Sandaracinobacteroides hominis]|uniref:TetR family transcriptional regulator n=1 Tax=Sandaracinobacteroides hominis TaxID=2780086 RepID=UPI0018F5DCD6|nr:TetR family transcriptional regulator [Sandaracinobacteroides hominis]